MWLPTKKRKVHWLQRMDWNVSEPGWIWGSHCGVVWKCWVVLICFLWKWHCSPLLVSETEQTLPHRNPTRHHMQVSNVNSRVRLSGFASNVQVLIFTSSASLGNWGRDWLTGLLICKTEKLCLRITWNNTCKVQDSLWTKQTSTRFVLYFYSPADKTGA
jgi:hypothetical protein